MTAYLRLALFGLAAFLLTAAASSVGAAPLPAELAPLLKVGAEARVVSVVDGDTVILDRKIEGSNQVRLVGIQAPKLPLGRAGFTAWPLAGPAKAHLEKILARRSVTLAFGGARMDRHGRLLAHLILDDGVWVQGRMLADGFARVYSFIDNRRAVSLMLAAEGRARKSRLGIWGDAFYAVRDGADEGALGRDLGTFQVVEGLVVDAAKVKGTVYLNFGADWRQDFTARIPSRARRLFEKEGLDPVSLKGQRVRVRGWLDRRDGPMIDLGHPEQIEIVDDANN